MKKLASLLLALVMLISCVPAMAEEGETTTSETTITPVETNTTISLKEGETRTYAVYQIFTGDLAVKSTGDESTKSEVLSTLKWGANGTGTASELVDEKTINDLLEVNSESDSKKLEIINSLVNWESAPLTTLSPEKKSETVPTGYYLFKDVTTNLGEGESYSLFVVEIVGPTTINPKTGTISFEKKVMDINDSTDTDFSNWQDSADHDIGDEVPFKLTAKLPQNFNDYKAYYLVFHDEQSKGLSFNADSVEVTVNGTEISDEYYDVITETGDNCTFEIEFINLKAISTVGAGSEITVVYTSTLNNEAVIGSLGNPNEMYLEYSNNPNSDWDATDKDEDGKPDKPDDKDTSETLKDKVIVFTYELDVNKITEDKTALTGANFQLYKWDADADNTTTEETTPEDATTDDNATEGETAAKGAWVEVGTELTGEALSKFVWKGLDDGQYKLEETKAPAGYNLLTAPIYFTISATHDVESADPQLTKLEVIDETGAVISTFTATFATGIVETSIVNKPGAQLPSTGGMGTTILYVGGGILVLAAIVLLIVKRRANAE